MGLRSVAHITFDDESYTKELGNCEEFIKFKENVLDDSKEFGTALGLAFQIKDDLLDFYDTAQIGKVQ